MSVYLLLCPRVGPRGEGVGEIVVEWPESVQDKEINSVDQESPISGRPGGGSLDQEEGS